MVPAPPHPWPSVQWTHHVGHRDTQEPSRGHTASKQLSHLKNLGLTESRPPTLLIPLSCPCKPQFPHL